MKFDSSKFRSYQKLGLRMLDVGFSMFVFQFLCLLLFMFGPEKKMNSELLGSIWGILSNITYLISLYFLGNLISKHTYQFPQKNLLSTQKYLNNSLKFTYVILIILFLNIFVNLGISLISAIVLSIGRNIVDLLYKAHFQEWAENITSNYGHYSESQLFRYGMNIYCYGSVFAFIFGIVGYFEIQSSGFLVLSMLYILPNLGLYFGGLGLMKAFNQRIFRKNHKFAPQLPSFVGNLVFEF